MPHSKPVYLKWNQWDKNHHSFCRLVAEYDSEIIGWAAILPVSQRAVYKGVAEVSIYVMPSYSGKGIGKKLLGKLIEQSENNGIWTLQASIFPENAASMALFRSCGFIEAGFRERIGKMNDVWRDTILLERRMK